MTKVKVFNNKNEFVALLWEVDDIRVVDVCNKEGELMCVDIMKGQFLTVATIRCYKGRIERSISKVEDTPREEARA